MKNITLEVLKDKFRNQSAIAEQLNISRQAVSKWFIVGSIPKLRQYELTELLLDNTADNKGVCVRLGI